MPDKIRILFLFDEILQATAGSEQHLSFLLNNLDKERYEIHLALLRNKSGLPPGFSPVEPVVLNLYSFKNISETYRAAVSIKRLLKKKQIQITHVFFNDSELLAALAVRDSNGCRKIIARRNMGYKDSTFLRLRNRATGKLKGNYLVNCEAIKRYLISSERIPPERIIVIYNPINQERLEQGMAAPLERERWGINDGDLVVGIVANIRPVKDYETFFKAAILVAERVANAKFLVVGSKDGDYWEKLRGLVESAPLRNHLVLAGSVANPFPAIRLFNVGVLSSTSEGFSNSLVEYAAAGIPTVASDVGGNREIVGDGKTGYLVPSQSPELLASKIIDLLLDEDKRKEFGQNAREVACYRFSQEIILRQYEEYYKEKVIS